MIPPDTTKPIAVQITYSPSTEISKGDTITINGNTNIVPTSIIDQSINVGTIVSETQINVNIPSLITPATSGTFTLHTTMDNCLSQSASDATSDVTGAVTAVGGGVLSSLMGTATSIFGPALIWIEMAIGLIICVPLLIFIIKILIKIFRH